MDKILANAIAVLILSLIISGFGLLWSGLKKWQASVDKKNKEKRNGS